MRTTTLLAVAALLAACGSDERSAEKRSPGTPERAVTPAPSLAAQPPISRSVASSIAGKQLRSWITTDAATRVTPAAELPAAVAAELAELLAPVALDKPRLRWAAALTGSGKPGRTVAVAYDYTAPGGPPTLGFTAAADRQGMYVINQAVELATATDSDLELGTPRDGDGDGIPDAVVVYRQRAETTAPPTHAGLILVGSRTATTTVIPLFHRRVATEKIEQLRTWGGCWTLLAGRPVLILIRHEETLVRIDGAEKPLRSGYAGAVYAPDEEGKLAPTTLYVGVLGSANTIGPLTEEWREWIGDDQAELPVSPEGALTWDLTTCPTGQQMALVVPAGATRPRGGDGYHLLAWPALTRTITTDGVTQARLPVSAVVELGVTTNLR